MQRLFWMQVSLNMYRIAVRQRLYAYPNPAPYFNAEPNPDPIEYI
jgi:hypothetical protein